MGEIRGAAGRILRECRKRRGVTQKDLAARSGVSVGAIGVIENGKVNPGFETVLMLIDALGYEIKVSPKGSRKEA